MRVTKIFKMNTSLGVLLPPSIHRTLKWKQHDYIVVEIFEKELVLSKLEFPPHVIKRLSEKRQRVYESVQQELK